MNYAQLSSAIQQYTSNTETSFVANIPLFLEQAEQRIYNTIQFPSLRKNVLGITTSSNKYLSCPDDFLSVYSMAVITNYGTVTENYTYLLNKDVNFIRESYPNSKSVGLPAYYALFGPTVVNAAITNELSFILGPTPDTQYNVELHYYYYPVSIGDTVNNPSGTTWLGDNFDTVLLYGALVEAYTYMKGEADMVQLYDAKYKEALMLAKRLGDGMERQDAYRSGQYRQAVT
jgi:hypothetical protein